MSARAILLHRNFELPWTVSEEEQERFRRMWRTALGVVLLISIAMPWLPVPERAFDVPPPVPPRIAQLVLERAIPPPPPPPVREERVETRPQTEQRPVEQPVPELKRTQDARKKASQAGLLPFVDQLADLRDRFDVKQDDLKPLASAKGDGGTPRAERSLITARTGTLTGGINTAGISRGFGSGTGTLDGHGTTRMQLPFGGSGAGNAIGGAGDTVSRSGGGKKASRSQAEIELVFDKNKSAIYSLYNRALRDNPALLGKVVFELTIAPWGEVTTCSILSSELKDSELERKLIARIRMFRFEDKDVEAMTTTKPIEFFPA
ncbi:MAG: AgmX/PglI C-terminal domain-containing protein [Steroidobacteraceae bacterium]